jgi:SAM-dependent methyltransferase
MLTMLPNIDVHDDDGVLCYFRDGVASASDAKEYVAQERASIHCAQSGLVQIFDDLVFRSPQIKQFTRLIPKLRIAGHELILEMGAGQGWASVLLKRLHPTCRVIVSDLVPRSLQFTSKYEQLVETPLDAKWAFNCRAIPFADAQFDLIFTLAAFHHFGENNDFGRSLEEMLRVLKPGGRIVLLYEPSAPRYLYKWMYKIVNKRRTEDFVDEDVLVVSKIAKYAVLRACEFHVEYYPDHHDRNLKAATYYLALGKLRMLRSLLPCTINITIVKQGRPGQ